MDEYGGVIRDPYNLTVDSYKKPVKWLPKETEFKLALMFHEFHRVTKNSFGIFVSQYDSRKAYPFSVPRMLDMMVSNVIDHGRVAIATYTVVKQGGIYSMKFKHNEDRFLELAEGDKQFAQWLAVVDQKLRLPPLDSYDYSFLRQCYDEGCTPLDCILQMNNP